MKFEGGRDRLVKIIDIKLQNLFAGGGDPSWNEGGSVPDFGVRQT